MKLTKGQEQGLHIALERYKNKEPYTTIAGYAGVGKSTLVRFIIEALNLDPVNNVAYISFTGKAAQVLHNKGCHNAMTAHRLLYHSRRKPDGTFFHVPKDYIGSYKVVVVDEVSMLPKNMWDLLLSHKKHVIALGDPFQLPPVGEDNGILEQPHIFLDEIMRQAEDSEIIRLSADIRARKPIKPFKGKEVNIVRRRDMVDGMLTWADQIICGKNDTRHALNTYFRKMKWRDAYDDAPLVGEKLVCHRNNWDRINKLGDALVNGSMGTLASFELNNNRWLEKKCIIDFIADTYDEDSTEEDRLFSEVLIDWKLITQNKPTVTQENYRMFPRWLKPELFEYGYVITCHRAQGSEYDKVLVYEEILKATDHARWLYTSMTRASKRLTLVLKD